MTETIFTVQSCADGETATWTTAFRRLEDAQAAIREEYEVLWADLYEDRPRPPLVQHTDRRFSGDFFHAYIVPVELK